MRFFYTTIHCAKQLCRNYTLWALHMKMMIHLLVISSFTFPFFLNHNRGQVFANAIEIIAFFILFKNIMQLFHWEITIHISGGEWIIINLSTVEILKETYYVCISFVIDDVYHFPCLQSSLMITCWYSQVWTYNPDFIISFILLYENIMINEWMNQGLHFLSSPNGIKKSNQSENEK